MNCFESQRLHKIPAIRVKLKNGMHRFSKLGIGQAE